MDNTLPFDSDLISFAADSLDSGSLISSDNCVANIGEDIKRMARVIVYRNIYILSSFNHIEVKRAKCHQEMWHLALSTLTYFAFLGLTTPIAPSDRAFKFAYI